MSDTRYTIIKDRITTKLSGIGKLNEVLDYPTLEFGKYPSAYFVPAEGSSDWETNEQDERVYAFDIFLYYETKSGGKQNALNALYDLVDDVLDAFAQDKQLGDTSPTLQAQLTTNGYTTDTVVTVEPVSAGWEEVVDKELLRARIALKVRILISNQ